MSKTDRRSVGELLVGAELSAREVLTQAGGQDPAAMLRTWPEAVQAAGELWRALPDQRTPQPLTGRVGPHGDLDIVRLEQLAVSLHRDTRGHPWPGAGPGHEGLWQIADDLARAASLVQGHTATGMPADPPAQADLAATKARLMHTLYIASHGVLVAVGDYRNSLQDVYAARGNVPPGNSLQVARSAHARLAVFEQLAGAYVARTYPGALDGEHREPPSTGRLGQALARWDVQAHRTLTADPRAANVALTAHTQAFIISAAHILLNAAAHRGRTDPGDLDQRLTPALERTQSSWIATAQLWATLTPPTDGRSNPALRHVSGELRAALLELVHDRTATATPETIAARVDLGVAIGEVQESLSTATELAHLIAGIAVDPQVHGAARAVNTMTRQLTDAHQPGRGGADTTTAWVLPQDLATNRPVPLTDAVRERFRGDAADTTAAAQAAMHVAAILDPRPIAPSTPAAATPASASLRHLDHAAASPMPQTGAPRAR